MSKSSISMVIIVKNGRETICDCLASFVDHVDEIVICDTGSRDGTVAEIRRFAQERNDTDKLVLGRFKWCNDFAAARNHAHSLATSEWHCWIDCDETIRNAEHLRRLVASASRDIVGFDFVMPYVSADPQTAMGWRRLFRGNAGRWRYPLHEQWVPDRAGRFRTVDDVSWEHHRVFEPAGRGEQWKRDGRILEQWARTDPGHPIMLFQKATRRVLMGDTPGAELLLQKALRARGKHAKDPLDGVVTMLAELLAARGQFREARKLAVRAVRDHPPGPAAARLVLAQLAARSGDPEEALREALAGLEYIAGPSTRALCLVLCSAALAVDRPEEALEPMRRVVRTVDDPQPRELYLAVEQAYRESRPLLAAMPSLDALLTV